MSAGALDLISLRRSYLTDGMNRCRIGTYTEDPVKKVGLTTCKTELCSLDPGSARYDQWKFFWRLWAESWSDWSWYVRYQTLRLIRFLISHFRGTGSSCIYPLLSCSQRPKWRLAATGKSYVVSGRDLYDSSNNTKCRNRRKESSVCKAKHTSKQLSISNPPSSN